MTAQLVSRLRPFGETIFATMTALAKQHGAVNLGQGFPSEDGPDAMLERAQHEIAAGNNQYAPVWGFPELREAIAADRQERYGLTYDPASEVLVTVGATEGLTAAILALVEPGSEVIVLEPYYDSYAAAIALAGAVLVPVPLVWEESPDAAEAGCSAGADTAAVSGRWALDAAALAAAVTSRTRLIIVNTPHNPTGAVLTSAEISQIGEIAAAHDLLILADEVYETLVYDGAEHVPVASVPGLAERTITVSSAAKRFNVTGWKTGWVLAPAELTAAVLRAKQFLTFVGVSHVQPAVALALRTEREWELGLRASLCERRKQLTAGLREAGLLVRPARGGYFVTADVSPLGVADAGAFCTGELLRAGVAAIPVAAFVSAEHAARFSSLVRFAFCRPAADVATAVRRLHELRVRS